MNWKSTCQTTIEWYGYACPVWYLPRFEGFENVNQATNKKEEWDERFHLLATFLASYPDADTNTLAVEFGLGAQFARKLANFYGVYKSESKRREICHHNGDNPRSRSFLWFRKNKMKNKKEED